MKFTLAAPVLAGALLVAGGAAQGQSFIRQAGSHRVALEVEVHGVIGGVWWGYFATGVGVRFGIPLARNPGSINNMPALTMGVDAVWFPDYYGNGYAYLSSPVALQWNFYVHHRWSIAPEAGFALKIYPDWNGYCGGGFGYHGGGLNGRGACGYAIFPGVAFTARYHFHDNAGFPALVMRLGFPVGFNIGVSF